ncbi:MAG: hypothetical protein ACR2LQ_00025 [Acidimicrobiales bacterium]
MRFAVDSWDPDYGTPTEPGALAPSAAPTRIDAECAEEAWAPIAPSGQRAPIVVFVDGVRRIEARVWITEDDASVSLGVAASYGAGVVRCDGKAEVVMAEVERKLLTAARTGASIETTHGTFGCVSVDSDDPDSLSLELQRQMGRLEIDVARRAIAGEANALVVVDGPLRQHGHLPGTVGSIKAQHRSYGPPIVLGTVAKLAPGERTPVFVIGEPFPRWSWYVRLPGPVPHPLAGVVRCETTDELSTPEAIALAEVVTATLPRYASEPHKDSRAPQNLYPIGGLERVLRHRLGDQQLLLRALRRAAA